MTKMTDMEELIHALEMGKPDYDGEDVNYDVATIEDAITVIQKYAEIKKIVDEFNATRDSSPMVERAYAEYTKNEKVECFDQILDLFKEK